MYLPANQSDEELLRLLRTGDAWAFNALYDRYWERVYAQAFKGLRDPDLAKDITQEVFAYVWTNRGKLQIANLSAYLFSSVRNNVFRHLKKQQLFVPIPELLDNLQQFAGSADTNLIYADLIVAYQHLIDAMPPAQQTVFRMRYDEELSTAEIASQLNISRKTVQNQLTRAVSLLRASLLFLLMTLLLNN